MARFEGTEAARSWKRFLFPDEPVARFESALHEHDFPPEGFADPASYARWRSTHVESLRHAFLPLEERVRALQSR